MIQAYDKIYLEKTRSLLANMFDYVSNSLDISLEKFYPLFLSSTFCKRIEKCDVSITCGKSGIELARLILEEKKISFEEDAQVHFYERSKEFWCGYYIAYFQWKTSLSFKRLDDIISIKEILMMYDTYHEVDISMFCFDLITKYNERKKETNLKLKRQFLGVSQSELAKRSGVPIRTIQQYEQRIKNINKANGETLVKLSRSLDCCVDDLMELIIDAND